VQDHRLELGKDVDLGSYVASGVVVFDLHRRTVKWSQVGVVGAGAGRCWAASVQCGLALSWPRGFWRVGQQEQRGTSSGAQEQRHVVGMLFGGWLPVMPYLLLPCFPPPLHARLALPSPAWPLQHLDLSTDYTLYKAYAYSGESYYSPIRVSYKRVICPPLASCVYASCPAACRPLAGPPTSCPCSPSLTPVLLPFLFPDP